MSNVPPGHRVVTRTSAITANYENTDPQKAVGDIEGIFIKKDTGKTVFGVGTKQPFSRISMGDINSPLEEGIPALAFTENIDGHYASGIRFYKDGNQKIGLRFLLNKLSGADSADIENTSLMWPPTDVNDAPILTLSKTTETVDSETFDNGQVAQTGNKVFINCIEPIRGDLSLRSGLEVNGMISFTDRLNFYRSSVLEDYPTGGTEDNRKFALYHEQSDGTRMELLTRAGQNRVIIDSSITSGTLTDLSENLASISVLPNRSTTDEKDAKGIFIFRDCDFVIGNGEMAAHGQLNEDGMDAATYWDQFSNISTAFINTRGNTIISSVFDISSTPIMSQACEIIDHSRNGVLYLQNNLGIGSRQPDAVIDCNKINLPFMKIGTEISDISNNTIAFGHDLNIPNANYSFLFGDDIDLSGSPTVYNNNFNLIFGKEINTSVPQRLNYSMIFGHKHRIEGDHNFVFGYKNQITTDVSYCAIFGHGGIIDGSNNDSPVMKYTLGTGNDIFTLLREGTLVLKKDFSAIDAYIQNRIQVKLISTEGIPTEQAYITNISGGEMSLTGDISCNNIIAKEIEAPTFKTGTIFANEVRAGPRSLYLGDSVHFFVETETDKKTLRIDASHNIILNTNNIDRFFINENGDVSIGEDNRTQTRGSFYVKDINQTISSNSLLQGMQFGRDTNNDRYLNIGTNTNKKIQLSFGRIGTNSVNKLEYDDNLNAFTSYYDGSYNIFNDSTQKLMIQGDTTEIYTNLTMPNSYDKTLTVRNQMISVNGIINFENVNNKIHYSNYNFNISTNKTLNIDSSEDMNITSNKDLHIHTTDNLDWNTQKSATITVGTNMHITNGVFKNTFSTSYSLFNNTQPQMKFQNNRLDIFTSRSFFSGRVDVPELFVNGVNVAATLNKTAGASAWVSEGGKRLYVSRKVGINIERGNDGEDELDNEFEQFMPFFELDVSGNTRTDNILLNGCILNMIPLKMNAVNSHVKNMGYGNGSYNISYNMPSDNSVYHLFDNSLNTYWDSSTVFVDGSANVNTLNVETSESILNNNSQYNINKTIVLLEGERVRITLPKKWRLMYYGLQRASSDLSKNMPSKWYVVGNKDTVYKLIDEKDISDNEVDYFQDDSYHYFKVDPSSNFARDNYNDFTFIFNQIFNKGVDVSCNIGGIRLYGELTEIDDLSSNFIQSSIQNNGLQYVDISHVNHKQTKHLTLQPIGGKVGIKTQNPIVTLDISGNDALRVPVGDNHLKHHLSENKLKGCIRFNTVDNQFEGCDGVNWGGLGGVISLDQKTKILATDASGLIFINDNSENMIIDESGNIGVGTMQPKMILDISANDAIMLPNGISNERPVGNYEPTITNSDYGVSVGEVDSNEYFFLHAPTVSPLSHVGRKDYHSLSNGFQSDNLTYITGSGGFRGLRFFMNTDTYEDYPLKIATTVNGLDENDNSTEISNSTPGIYRYNITHEGDGNTYVQILFDLKHNDAPKTFYYYADIEPEEPSPEEPSPEQNPRLSVLVDNVMKITVEPPPNDENHITNYIKYNGSIRFNNDDYRFEGYNGTRWDGFQETIDEDSTVRCKRILISEDKREYTKLTGTGEIFYDSDGNTELVEEKNNTIYGFEALMKNRGSGNTAIGSKALKYNTSNDNTAVGEGALTNNVSGYGNTSIGTSSLHHTMNIRTKGTQGHSSHGPGYTSTGKKIEDYLGGGLYGNYNTAVGESALSSNKLGSYNTAIGHLAGNNFNWNNLSLEPQQPALENGNDELDKTTCLGYNAKADISNVVILGDPTDATNKVGIGTKAPSTKLEVFGDISSNGLIVRGAVNLLNATSVEVPTQAITDDSEKVATTAFVQSRIAEVIDSAPAALDTLNEIAAALNNDSNAVATLTTSITNLSNNKQDNITDNDLQISHVLNLQTQLDGKQANVGANDLQISYVSGLQSALDGKQATIVDDGLAQSKVSGLVSDLTLKAPLADPVFTGVPRNSINGIDYRIANTTDLNLFGNLKYNAPNTIYVTVGSKTEFTHTYEPSPGNAKYGQGSSNAYFLNGIESPSLTLVRGETYTFIQEDSTNVDHPIMFYINEDKSGGNYSGDTTSSGITGDETGAYVSFTVPSGAPNKIYYQCQSHPYMGSKYGFNIVDDNEVNNIAFHKNVSIGNNVNAAPLSIVNDVPVNFTTLDSYGNTISNEYDPSNNNLRLTVSKESGIYIGRNNFDLGHRLEKNANIQLISNGISTIDFKKEGGDFSKIHGAIEYIDLSNARGMRFYSKEQGTEFSMMLNKQGQLIIGDVSKNEIKVDGNDNMFSDPDHSLINQWTVNEGSDVIKMHVQGNTRINGALYLLDGSGNMINVYDKLMEAMVSGSSSSSSSSSGSGSSSGSSGSSYSSSSSSSATPPSGSEYKYGQVLEVLSGVCDGRSITVDSGTYQLENIQLQDEQTLKNNNTMPYLPANTQTWTFLPGSSISYKPLHGTSEVIYEFAVFVHPSVDKNDYISFGYSLWISDNPDFSNEQQIGPGRHVGNIYYGEMSFNLQHIISIGDNDNLSNGKLSSWSEMKYLRLKVVNRGYGLLFNQGRSIAPTTGNRAYALNDYPGLLDQLVRPEIKITAIGATYDGGAFSLSGNNAYFIRGNVGIGTSTPLHALDVAGEIHATGNIVSFTTSDRKLKTNILPIEDPLEKLKKINGYTFEWVKDKDTHSFEGKDIGVIAQEIEEILPEATTTRDNGYKAVRYEKMVPFLIACIKEQQKQIDELKELIKK